MTATATSIAEGILARYQRYGWSTPQGEWGDIQAQRPTYRKILESGNPEVVTQILSQMFRNRLTNGIVGGAFKIQGAPDGAHEAIWREMVEANCAVWRQDTDAPISLLRAPDVGMPNVGVVAGWPILFDTPRHDHYALHLQRLLPDGGTVLEIGGGYGGVACQLMRRQAGIQHVICDLPETLYLSWYWLSRACPETSIAWYDEDPDAQIVLVPAQEIEQWEKADVWFAAHSLGEMELSVVTRYVAWAHEHRPRWLYHDNADAVPKREIVSVAGGLLDTSQSTAQMFPEVLASAYPIDPALYRLVSRTAVWWAGASDRYAEYLYEAC